VRTLRLFEQLAYIVMSALAQAFGFEQLGIAQDRRERII
jgi:hypothetical protein